jgi:hypothetical protein
LSKGEKKKRIPRSTLKVRDREDQDAVILLLYFLFFFSFGKERKKDEKGKSASIVPHEVVTLSFLRIM